jgi:N-succinyldiaminopimelate aminotransferase
MPLNSRLDVIGDYSFDRLRALLGGIEPPSGIAPIALSLGEPQHAPPEFLAETISKEAAGWSKYPMVRGTDIARTAISDWLTRRYNLPSGMVNPDIMVVPVSGTREALFMIALAAVPEKTNNQKPVVLMPNPFYQVYLGAAVTAGAEPFLVPADRENGFLPDYAGLPDEILERTVLAYYCSPANPQGAIASIETMKRLVELARAHDFILVSDECYSELYYGDAPAGAAEACAALGDGPDNAMRNVVAMNSLSKRSSAPGLRSGFVAGDSEIIRRFARLRDYGGAPPPLPLLAAASALWSDEKHVISNRALYASKYKAAEKIFGGKYGYYTPDGGFYLWLHVGDGEAAAQALWGDAGVRVIPGEYLARKADGHHPGAGYIRLALVHDLQTTQDALNRIIQVLK